MTQALRAVAVVEGGSGEASRDTLLLDHALRRAPQGEVTALRGLVVQLGLPRGTRLRHDDRVMLEDGGTVQIVARPEPLIEARASDPTMLARAAWLLGDHHIPVEIHARSLRLSRSDHAVTLLRGLGVGVRDIEAPFDPEGGAYDHAGDRAG